MVSLLNELGYNVKNHMSSVEEDALDKIQEKFNKEKETVKKNYQKQKLLHEKVKPKKSKFETNKAEAEDNDIEVPSYEKSKEIKPDLKKDKFKKSKKFEKGSSFKSGRKHKEQEEKDIQQSVKKTFAKMSQSKKLKKYRKVTEETVANEESMVITVPEFISTGELADELGVDSSEVIAKAMELGIMATINQRLDMDVITLIASEFGYDVNQQMEFDDLEEESEEEDPEAVERPPIVTIMGHVDHGKTTLLDHIRKSDIVSSESGGITQHIGAYQVVYQGKKITFIDTPGHEAFTTMRARGAQVTDLVILVVAANDGIMPQTIEAINHAKAAGVAIIVAINKIDLPQANPDRIKQQLAEHGLTVEEWGGDTIAVPISAKQGTNIDKLLEMVLLVAELNEFKGNTEKKCSGIIIESKLDKGRGPIGTLLIQNGSLRIGDNFICGYNYGKIRAMHDEHGKRIKFAAVSQPVQIVGFSGVPDAGDQFREVETEAEAKQISNKRMILKRERDLRAKHKITLENVYDQIKSGEMKELNIVIKGDTNGSVEAIADSLVKVSNEEVKINIIHKGVGGIIEADIMLASASNALIIGFHVRPSAAIKDLANKENVSIRNYEIIYDVIDDVEASLKGMLAPQFEEITTGEAEIRETFKIPKVGTIAGCYVRNGSIIRKNNIRLIRDGIIIFQGNLSSLKRFKDDVREVSSGYECGLGIEGYNDLKIGDIIEQYEKREIKR